MKGSYGRKKNLRAIWLCQEDGGNPIEMHVGLARLQFPGKPRQRTPLLETPAIGSARRRAMIYQRTAITPLNFVSHSRGSVQLRPHRCDELTCPGFRGRAK